MIVFDKTGTLTEEGLQVFGFRGTESAIISRK
jgi:magnesium-transporting ATPase (P-type)